MAKSKKTEEGLDLGVMEMGTVAVLPSYGNVFGFYQARGKAIPTYETEFSAGMDVRADLEMGDEVHFYNHSNVKGTKTVRNVDGVNRIYVEPGERVLVPTGLHADIASGYYLAIHARSGTSWKQGLIVTNSVGVVDADYVEEIKVSLTNISGARVVIEDGERIAQLLLKTVEKPFGGFARLSNKPAQKTSRSGGFGSTGAK